MRNKLRTLLLFSGLASLPAPASVHPSIVFVIDNSGSMSNGPVDTHPTDASDPDEARFTVVRTLLDTLAAVSPTSEVGLVIFTRRLMFDTRDNAFFKPAFPGDTSQYDAFVPLTPLNRSFPDGKTGLDTLKDFLKYTGNGNLIYSTRFPDSRPSSNSLGPDDIRDGTDITLGFEAAKEAMKDAKVAKADQYIIFLSDGLPSNVDIPRASRRNDYIKGTATPATFTVFFNVGSANPALPENIEAMTDSIKANGYSESNPKSVAFAITMPGAQLLEILQNHILNAIFHPDPFGSGIANRNADAFMSSRGILERTAAAQAGYRFRFKVQDGSGQFRRVDARGKRMGPRPR